MSGDYISTGGTASDYYTAGSAMGGGLSGLLSSRPGAIVQVLGGNAYGNALAMQQASMQSVCDAYFRNAIAPSAPKAKRFVDELQDEITAWLK